MEKVFFSIYLFPEFITVKPFCYWWFVWIDIFSSCVTLCCLSKRFVVEKMSCFILSHKRYVPSFVSNPDSFFFFRFRDAFLMLVLDSIFKWLFYSSFLRSASLTISVINKNFVSNVRPLQLNNCVTNKLSS